ncbi:MAG: Hsp20/alpha crystallin family protein [Flavobacteriales bacterium]|nr:Hsp20/alpha crystallin family protein [Flavobacteriales bacterium]
MKTLVRTNGNPAKFPSVPKLFDDLFMRDLFDMPLGTFRTKPSIPSVNISETDKNILVEMAVPGMDKKDINLELENGRLNIWADKTEEKDESSKNFTRKEYGYYSFHRSFDLPENMIDKNKISAKYKHGILSIDIPRSEQALKKSGKKIKVS